MKRSLQILTVLITMFSSVCVYSQTSLIQELMVLDSSSTGFRFNRQSMITDNYGNLHLLYVSHSSVDNADYIIKRTSTDNGNSWGVADTVSVYNPTSMDYSRFLALAPMAVVDELNNLHIMYEYRGEPVYNSSYSGYPPSHFNYVHMVDNEWVTEVDVINDHDIQSAQGNASTVCYLLDNHLVSYNGVQYFTAYDYAWWATKYNIVYSDNSLGEWATATPSYTYDLGSIDTRILRATSFIENNDSLFSIWYQSHDCQVEMKAFDGMDWSDMTVVYTDAYIPETGSNHYNVSVGSYSDGSESRVTMFRVPQADFNELLLLSKSAGQPWMTDTLMLENSYSAIRPFAAGDTTYLFMIYSSDLNYSYLVKYLSGQGDISKSMLQTSEMEDKFYNLISSDKSVNPVAYMVYDEYFEKYILKIGRVDGVIGIDEDFGNKANSLSLSQNYPNPFYGTTHISYHLSNNSKVKIEVYNLMGQLVKTLVDELKSAGNHSEILNTKDLKSGIYFYNLKVEGLTLTKRMVKL